MAEERYGAFVTPGDRRCLTEWMQEAFEGFALGVDWQIQWLGWTGRDNNAEEVDFMGDAEPTFAPPVSLVGYCEFQRSNANQTYWGEDEMVMGLCYLRTAEARAAGVYPNNRGQIRVTRPNGRPEVYGVQATHWESGMGHEEWLTVLRLVPPTVIGTYEEEEE